MLKQNDPIRHLDVSGIQILDSPASEKFLILDIRSLDWILSGPLHTRAAGPWCQPSGIEEIVAQLHFLSALKMKAGPLCEQPEQTPPLPRQGTPLSSSILDSAAWLSEIRLHGPQTQIALRGHVWMPQEKINPEPVPEAKRPKPKLYPSPSPLHFSPNSAFQNQ